MKLTNALLRRAYKSAVEHAKMSHLISEAMIERYGVTHSDADCDDLIDALEYGHGDCPTVEYCDKAMGYSKK